MKGGREGGREGGNKGEGGRGVHVEKKGRRREERGRGEDVGGRNPTIVSSI